MKNVGLTARYWSALKLSVGMTTAVPVGDVTSAAQDRRTVGRAILLTPLIGLLIAAIAVVLVQVLRALGRIGSGDSTSWTLTALLIAAITITFVQWITRALHVDGLADTADALAAPGSREHKRAVMKRSDIGPTGALALVATLLIQVVALGTAIVSDRGSFALVTALVAGRLSLVWAVRLPPATSEGLGAWVSGTVRVGGALVATLFYWALAGLALLLDDDPIRDTDLLLLLAIPAAIGVTQLLYWRWRSAIGGITGDTLGAGVEIGTAVALVVVALVA